MDLFRTSSLLAHKHVQTRACCLLISADAQQAMSVADSASALWTQRHCLISIRNMVVSTTDIVRSHLSLIPVLAAGTQSCIPSPWRKGTDLCWTIFLSPAILFLCMVAGLQAALRFSPAAFFYGLLPPIVFAAGFTLKKRDFFRNFGTISVFAVPGTFISALFFGLFTYALVAIKVVKRSHLGTAPLIECLLYGEAACCSCARQPSGSLAGHVSWHK